LTFTVIANLIFLATPAHAQHVDDPGDLQIATSAETEKDSGVWIDSEYIGYLRDFWGNKKILLSPGEHELTVRKFGYKPFTSKIQIESGKTFFFPIHMELDVNTQYPTKNTAQMRINVTPPEAAVLVDGAYVGYVRQIGGLFKTKTLPVLAGKHNFRIEMKGYSPYEMSVELTAGQRYEIRTALPEGGPELEGAPRIIQAAIHDGDTSIELSPGRIYLYGFAVGGQGRSNLFSLGNWASVLHEGGTVGAAIAFDDTNQNTYTTETSRHILGGVSVGGSWQKMQQYFSSNAAPAASQTETAFTLDQNSFVVVLALASTQQQISLDGLPGMELDTFFGGPDSSAAMSIAHAELPPGSYTVTEHSSALAADADKNAMSDLLAVFVFNHH
jgi:hypothetical protein